MASSGWVEFLPLTEMTGAMSIIITAKKQLYSQKVKRQEDVGLALSWQ